MVGVIKNRIRIPESLGHVNNEAEIIGIMLGDGYIYKNGYTIRLQVREKDFIKNFSELIEKTYGIKASNKVYDYPCSFVNSKELAKRLIELTQNNKKIPNFILNGSKETKARFLRGFIDSEGSVDVIYNRRQIVVTQMDIGLLKQLKSLLSDLGIQSRVIKKKYDSNKLIISLLENLEQYNKLIGFSIKYKQKKLNSAINYLRKCKAYDKEKYWVVLRCWLKWKKSLRSFAKEMAIIHETCRTWIYGQKMPCQIKMDIEYSWVPNDYGILRKKYSFLSNKSD